MEGREPAEGRARSVNRALRRGVKSRRRPHEPRSMSIVRHGRLLPNRAMRPSRCSVPAWPQRL